jgi:MYXO-CTERM domain-containing protein
MIDGKTYAPASDEFPLMVTPGGLSAPDVEDELAVVDPGTWVGLEVIVPEDADPLRGAALREVVVDGILGTPVKCGKDTGNVLLFDVTGTTPTLVGAATGAVLPYNRRVDVGSDFEVRNGHTYRVMALVTESRSFAASKSKSWLGITGAVRTITSSPCDGMAIAASLATDDEGRTMAIRWRERQLPEKPVDTADTGGDTGDTGTTTDDSGKSGKDSPPPIDAGRNDGYEDGSAGGGCSCSSRATPAALLGILLGLPLALRRRRSTE